MQGTSGQVRETSAGMRAEPKDEKFQDEIQPSEDDFTAYFRVEKWKARKKCSV
jgi:hypothetical protein